MASSQQLQGLVDDYLADCRARGLAPKTLHVYGYPLQRVLLPWCEQQGIRETGGLDSRALNRFTSNLLERAGERGTLSRHRVDSYVRAVNLFLRWRAVRRGRSATCVRRRRGSLGGGRCADQGGGRPPRGDGTHGGDKVIVRLLADTGIRADELLTLRGSDLLERGRDRFISVRGRSQSGVAKGTGARLVPRRAASAASSSA